MSSNEEYLDSLLKQMTDLDTLDVNDNQKPDEISLKEENGSDLDELLKNLEQLEEADSLQAESLLFPEHDEITEEEITEKDYTQEDYAQEHFLQEDELNEFQKDEEDLTSFFDQSDSDDDLAAINDLLEKADDLKTIDDDMFSLLDEASYKSQESEFQEEFDFFADETEETNIHDELSFLKDKLEPEETVGKEKNKKEKKQKVKRVKNKSKSENLDENNLSDEDIVNGIEKEIKEKKQGFFSKIFNLLLEEPTETEKERITDENQSIIKEIDMEKKDYQIKEIDNKKNKKGKNGKSSADSELDDDLSLPKGKKGKNGKKIKKEKKAKTASDTTDLHSTLNRKNVSAIFIFCFALMACVIIVCLFIPKLFQLKEGRQAYYQKNYEKTYAIFLGEKLNNSDKIIFDKVSTILQVQRKWDSYNYNLIMNKEMEALDSLIQGVARYVQLEERAEKLQVLNECKEIYALIENELAQKYSLNNNQVALILTNSDPVTYTKILKSVIEGNGPDLQQNNSTNNMDSLDKLEDVLLEEEEIISQIEKNKENGIVNESETVDSGLEDSELEDAGQDGTDPVGELDENENKELYSGTVNEENDSIMIPNDLSR